MVAEGRPDLWCGPVTFYAIFLGAAWHAEESPWGGRQPDYLTFINRWDAGWYERIFDGGYPTTIPRNADGTAQPNQWAFYPIFPLLARGLSAVTGLEWAAAGAIIATVAGLAAALMIYVLFRNFSAPGTALWGVAFFATFPISAVLQVPYAESVGMFFLAAALHLLIKRNYAAAVPLVMLLCLAAGRGAVCRRRWSTSIAALEQAQGRAVSVAGDGSGRSAAGGQWRYGVWLDVHRLVGDGERSAYTDTETAWRGSDLVLFKPWFDAGVDLIGPLWGRCCPCCWSSWPSCP
ncbi:hypothetical protein NHF46_17015 [Arthrobacter alpinus]|nr:hypothetical protein [Arthrobacter alpinus]